MRTLIRNKIKFFYATYLGVTEVMRDGLHTGEYQISYSEPVEYYGNISAGNGNSQSELYGLTQGDYDKLIVLEDSTIPITETTVIWLENNPQSESYDYIVKRVARSLNSVTIAIKKVSTSSV